MPQLLWKWAPVKPKDLSLEIFDREIFGFLGPNGAGKTTTILMLLGLTEPTAGCAHVLGFDPAHEPLQIKQQCSGVDGRQHRIVPDGDFGGEREGVELDAPGVLVRRPITRGHRARERLDHQARLIRGRLPPRVGTVRTAGSHGVRVRTLCAKQ